MYAVIDAVISSLITLNSYCNRNKKLLKTYTCAIFLVEENKFPTKQAVPNAAECGCRKSSLSIKPSTHNSMQTSTTHMLCACGNKYIVFPSYFYDRKFFKSIVQVYLSPAIPISNHS